MSFSIQAIATSVPAILIVVGVLLITFGQEDLGIMFAQWGVFLQILYLVFRYGPAILRELNRR